MDAMRCLSRTRFVVTFVWLLVWSAEFRADLREIVFGDQEEMGFGARVATPFGREAMKQGARSAVTVAKGETLRLTFGALIHDHRELDPQFELDAFEQITAAKSNLSATE